MGYEGIINLLKENKHVLYFIWIRVNGKFWPSKLYGDYQFILRRTLDNIVFKKELRSDEKDLTLDQLVVKFPCPIFNVDE